MQATTEGSDAYKAAAHAYTGALFSKMRKLDPSQEESLSRKEGAYQRRIDAGKAIVE
jgi:ABC-type oligopeptide transport system ATPase subunit